MVCASPSVKYRPRSRGLSGTITTSPAAGLVSRR
jgi:hypothetical protein